MFKACFLCWYFLMIQHSATSYSMILITHFSLGISLPFDMSCTPLQLGILWSYSIHLLTTGWSGSCPDPSWTLAGRWSGSGWSSPWCSGGRGRWTWSLGYTDWILIIVGYNFTWPDLLSLWHTYLLISNIHYMANHIFYFYRFHGKMSMENSFPFAAQNLTATT